MNPERFSKKSFMTLPDGEVRRQVHLKNKSLTGIFVADGNRRLVMTQTGLTQESPDFYQSYLTIITGMFMENLLVFFKHGLDTLLFPIFGTSLLTRNEKYRKYVMPELIRQLFNSPKWQQFYQKYGIHIKAYGELELLDHHFGDLNLLDEIKHGEKLTAELHNHRLFYGFFSNPDFDLPTINRILQFIKDHQRKPNALELTQLYYGEPVAEADFFITSTRPGYLGALPPFTFGKKTRTYSLATPGIQALKKETFREILYDLLFSRPAENETQSQKIKLSDIDELKEYYNRNQNRVIGTGKIIGNWWVPDELN